MTRLIKKEDCTFENNYVVKEDEIIPLGSTLTFKLNALEGIYQLALWLSKKPDFCAAPDINEWHKEYSEDDEMPFAIPETPTLDAKVQETMAFLEDVDTVNFCKKMNTIIDDFRDVIMFARGSRFVEGYHPEPIDLKYLGNPLELTEARVMDVIEFIAKQGERYHINVVEEAARHSQLDTVLEF